MTMADESPAMRLLRSLGCDSLAWSLRRFHCPVPKGALVLEVGSGGNPYPRANVLLDAYEVSRERHWAPLATDRPTVLGFVENLPFKDKAFDFVIAAHVLEHSTTPEKFLSELERVARAGYIEVPDAFLERINPYRDHRLEITTRDATLVIRKKAAWQVEPETVELYEHRVKPLLTSELIPRHPFEFHVRHYWQNKIAYEVVNPMTDAAWEPPATDNGPQGQSLMSSIRNVARDWLRGALSQGSRNRTVKLESLLQCTSCGSAALQWRAAEIECDTCRTRFPIVQGQVPAMNRGTDRPA